MSSRYPPFKSNPFRREHVPVNREEESRGREGFNTFHNISNQTTFQPRHRAKNHFASQGVVTKAPSRPDFFSENGEDPRVMSTYRRRTMTASTLQRALRQLHKQLELAHILYSTSIGSFEGDIAKVKKYASSAIIDSLWAMKIQGKSMSYAAFPGEDNSTGRASKATLEWHDMSSVLTAALTAALNAKQSGLPSSPTEVIVSPSMAKHIRYRLQSYNSIITDLLGQATTSFANCKELAKEIQSLKEFVDPASENNKDLYPPGPGDTRNSNFDESTPFGNGN